MMRNIGLIVLLGCVGCASERSSDPSATGTGQARVDLAASNEAYFQKEARDEQWATTREGLIRSHLAPLVGVDPLTVECRAKLCKVEMHFADPALYESMGTNFTSVDPGEFSTGGVATHIRYDQEHQTALWWISRAGFAFPRGGAAPMPLAQPQP